MKKLLPLTRLGSKNYWENAQLSNLNKLPPRASLLPFPTPESALSLDRTKSPWFLSLNGKWDFQIKACPEQVSTTIFKSQKWDNIQVPGNWTMQSDSTGRPYGKPHYTNVQMPFPNRPPNVPDENPTGIYRRRFTLPKSWQKSKNRRVILHFAGCEGALSVYINRKAVGISKDARTPAEFDITELVTYEDENELIAVVVQWSDAAFLEDQDHWWQAGLQRDVFIYSTNIPHIQDVYAVGDLTPDYRDGRLKLLIKVGYYGELYDKHHLAVQLYDPDDKPTLTAPLLAQCGEPKNRSGSPIYPASEVHLETPIRRPKQWTTETPHLYKLVVTLCYKDDKGREKGIESVACQIGFRKIEIRGRQLLINGKPPLINGVNYHDHDDTSGKAISPEQYEKDIQTMKRFNVNAIRTAHYPKDVSFYELCDRYGLYVIDEANIETHAYYQEICMDPRYTNAFVERVRAMVERDKNHPCVIFWSLGNESGYGPNHDAAAGYIRQAEPSRPLHYEGAINNWTERTEGWSGGQRVTDVVCPMYASIKEIVEWAEAKTDDPRPMILCEYSHCMGNSNGSLSDYFAAFEKYPALQGGFLWEWVDHGIKKTTSDGKGYWGYGGDFDDEPNDVNFVCDGIVWPDRTPHPALYEFQYLAAPLQVTAIDIKAGRVRITNRQNYVGMDWLRGEWELTTNGSVVAQGKLPALKGDELEWELPSPHGKTTEDDGNRFLNFRFYQKSETSWAAAGHLVAWQQLAFPITKAKKRIPQNKTSSASASIESGPTTFTLALGTIRAIFDAKSGALTYFGKESNLITRGPRPNFWRAATDNDGLKLRVDWPQDSWRTLARWLELGLHNIKYSLINVKALKRGKQAPAIEVLQRASGRENWSDFIILMRYTLLPDGILEIENTIKLGKEMVDIPRIGINLSVNSTLEQIEYFGRGPLENYWDRKASSMVGQYKNTVSGEYVPYIMPQEHGHHTDVRWLTLKNKGGNGLEITTDINKSPFFEFNASHFSEADLYAATHTCELKARPEVILNLDAAHRGLGTQSCGPDTLEQYQIQKKEYHFTFRIKII